MNTREAATHIGIRPATVRWHATSGRLRGTKVGAYWAFEPEEVARFRDLVRKPGDYEGPRGRQRWPKQLEMPLAESRKRRLAVTQPRLIPA